MKIGELVKIGRSPNGLYTVQKGDDEPVYIGNAASTIIALSHLIFIGESSGNSQLYKEEE